MAKVERESSEIVQSLDDALNVIGCGCVQLRQHALFCLMCLPFAFQSLFMVFAGDEPAWRCKSNTTSCPYTQPIGKDSPYFTVRCKLERAEWEFVKSEDWSIVTEFDLVCDKAVWVNLSGSAFFVGAVFGALIFGWVADRYGRRTVLWPSLLVAETASAISAVAPNIWLFSALRLVSGFYYYGVALALTIMSCEIVGPRFRAISGVSLWNYFALGLVFLGIQAYFITSWKTLGLVCSLPYFVIFIFIKFVPESARWLWVKGKEDQSQEILSEMCKINGKTKLFLERKAYTGSSPNTSSSFTDLFKSKKMAVETLAQGYLWFVQGLLYYGFFLISDNLSGNIYRDFILASVMDIPANFLSVFCARRFGRRQAFLASVAIATGACATIAVFAFYNSEGLLYARLATGLLGKFFVANGSNLLYVWSPEIYPTVVRSKAMGIFSALRPMGGAAAPWMIASLLDRHASFPFAALATLSLLGGFCCLLLPETKDKKMLDNFEEKGIDNTGFTVGEWKIDIVDRVTMEADRSMIQTFIMVESRENTGDVGYEHKVKDEHEVLSVRLDEQVSIPFNVANNAYDNASDVAIINIDVHRSYSDDQSNAQQTCSMAEDSGCEAELDSVSIAESSVRDCAVIFDQSTEDQVHTERNEYNSKMHSLVDADSYASSMYLVEDCGYETEAEHVV